MREEDRSQRGAKGEKPSRTCVGCHARIDGVEREGSFRVVLAEGSVAVDLAGSSFGRGSHVHATEGCVAKACAGGFSKAFRCQVVVDPHKLAEDVAAAASRRIEGLLLGARRAGLLAFGEEAKGSSADDTPLFIVARDAGSSALGGPLRQAVADGRVLPFGTKESLGKLFSRELVALVAVRHESVAREIRKANSLTESLVTSLGARVGVQIAGVTDAGLGRFDE
jgi:predicted RNA-binding protein YlxR (DUF448 family)